MIKIKLNIIWEKRLTNKDQKQKKKGKTIMKKKNKINNNNNNNNINNMFLNINHMSINQTKI